VQPSPSSSQPLQETSAVPAQACQAQPAPQSGPTKAAAPKAERVADYDAKKRADADTRKRDRDRRQLQARIADLEGRITEREQEIAKLEAAMSQPGFYEDREKSKTVVDRHQALMWEVGDLMGQWEALQTHAAEQR
jgi:ATP-binding cassette subfamily F protein 3